jgi:hypothetical protein
MGQELKGRAKVTHLGDAVGFVDGRVQTHILSWAVGSTTGLTVEYASHKPNTIAHVASSGRIGTNALADTLSLGERREAVKVFGITGLCKYIYAPLPVRHAIYIYAVVCVLQGGASIYI